MRGVAVEDCPRPHRPHPRLARPRGRAQLPQRNSFDDDLLELLAMVLGWMMLGLRVVSVRRGR